MGIAERLRRSAAAVLSIAVAVLLASCYADEAETWMKSGAAYGHGPQALFLLNYRIRRDPRGLSRFPDGGQARILLDETYLMADEASGGLRPVLHLEDPVPDRVVLAAEPRVADGALVWDIPGNGTGSNLRIVVDDRGARVAPSPVASETNDGSKPAEAVLSIAETNAAVKTAAPSALGLPSPLAFSDKRPRAYLDDVVMLRGDLAYRLEIIQAYADSADASRDLLERMERRLGRLDGLEATEYELYSEDTRTALEHRAGE